MGRPGKSGLGVTDFFFWFVAVVVAAASEGSLFHGLVGVLTLVFAGWLVLTAKSA